MSRVVAPLPVVIRHAVPRDAQEIAAIDGQSDASPWDSSFVARICRLYYRGPTVRVAVAEGGRVVGFVAYSRCRGCIGIHRLGVALDRRRRGVGTALLDAVEGFLSWRRPVLSYLVRETDLSRQLFLKARGLRAAEVVRYHYLDTVEDAYAFEARLQAAPGDPDESCNGLAPADRGRP